MGPLISSELVQTILVVDDSGTARMIIKQCLAIIGLKDKKYLEASNGRDALEVLKQSSVDLVVTDLNMPVMDGLCFIRELRKLSAYNGVPIVFLTTESDPGMKQQAKAAGATGWITKPFQQAQLLAVVKKVLGS